MANKSIVVFRGGRAAAKGPEIILNNLNDNI